MKNVLISCIILGSIAFFWVACQRDDSEPQYPPTPISRLYISFSNVTTSESDVFRNIWVISPADSTINENQLPNGRPYSSTSQAGQGVQGMGIVFDPYIERVFQITRLDSTIRSFTIDDAGGVGPSTFFKDTIRLRSARNLIYARGSDHLIVSDNATGNNQSALHLFYNPLRLAQQQKAAKRFNLQSPPYGLSLMARKEDPNMSNEEVDSILLVSMQGEERAIWSFDLKELSRIAEDSVQRTPNQTSTVEGASDLRGIAYSDNLDVLVLSDLGPTNGNDGNSADGSIYIIEDAKAKLSSGDNITPTRVIHGATANLTDPIAVAIDDREERQHYIYVADRQRRVISRFNLSDDGDTAPGATRSTTNLVPESIYLDARGGGGTSTENSQ
ncbi:hypothetical protein H8S90_07060 [Olivibacter sp. SDN3]|uniref:hypothetical protein n=1 Tax=Olivibacter sp. SDN3 TaxID=2764720 RepID=UPI00165174C0|nr:hypothetical protein [Olivibacter sp. SDN3]QNL51327.1 hypothetical protein H8S90_07060 [Olivibacter sp. SDN3]